jgi:hypothetical protein
MMNPYIANTPEIIMGMNGLTKLLRFTQLLLFGDDDADEDTTE